MSNLQLKTWSVLHTPNKSKSGMVWKISRYILIANTYFSALADSLIFWQLCLLSSCLVFLLLSWLSLSHFLHLPHHQLLHLTVCHCLNHSPPSPWPLNLWHLAPLGSFWLGFVLQLYRLVGNLCCGSLIALPLPGIQHHIHFKYQKSIDRW